MQKKKKDNALYSLYIAIILLTIALLVIIILETNIIDKIRSRFKAPIEITIKDDCSLMLNNIIHQIKTDGDCNIRCYNECKILEMKIQESEFIMNDNSCHTCNCYCK